MAFSVWNRRRKARLIAEFMTGVNARTVGVIGGIGSASQRNETVIERVVGSRAHIVAMLDVRMCRDAPWPSIVGDGRALPWRTNSVDLVLSNAVIEHVGEEADQRRFVVEHSRAGRAWVITTPNRWFPVESHTAVLLRHWSPSWRASRSEFTRLMSRREFRRLLPPGTWMAGHWWSPTFMAFAYADDGAGGATA